MTTLTTDLAYSSIAEIAPRLESGDISPVEVTRACLDRIAQVDPSVNAFITVLAESALQEAERAEREIRAGEYRGPLHGIPVAHKDLVYTHGVRTTAGSKVLTNFVPEYDATVATRLREAGSVLLGKLNMHEFAAGGTSENPHYGPVHNPWKLDHHPGGSSGGSSAALAAGMCLGATGSDTAGSIRIPSHCCGTTGIKPTYGRVSAYGVVSLSWSLDHVGPMTRSAHDAALMLNAMVGFDRRDSSTVERPSEDFAAAISDGVHGLRIGVPTTYFNEGLEPDVERAWRSAIDTLVGLGAVPVEVGFSAMEAAIPAGQHIVRSEMTVYHADWYARQPNDYSPEIVARFREAANWSAVDLVRAQRAREPIRDDLWAALDEADVLVLPVMSGTATPIGAEATVADLTRFTYPFNLSGFPSLSVPCGLDQQGLPIGIQLAARPWHEALLFRVGHAYQQATDWHLRRPSAIS